MRTMMGALSCLVALSGCGATTWYELRHGGERQAAIELIEASQGSGMPPEAQLSPERERLRWTSEDWTAGRVSQVGDDLVVVDSVIPGVGTMKLSVPPDAIVFDGNALVSLDQVPPGTAVRANFVGKSAAVPKLVSLEVLSPVQLTHLARR